MNKKKNKKLNAIAFTIFMIVVFFLITEFFIWGYGSTVILTAISKYPQGKLVITEAVLAVLVLIVTLLFKNSYVFTQKHERLTKGLFYGSYYIMGSIIFMLLYRNAFKEGLSVLNIAVGCFLVGVSEELLCRGWLLNEFLERFGTTKKGVWYSIVVSGIIFGLIHFTNVLSGQEFASTVIQVLTAGTAGILFGIIYYKTKNIWSVIILHALWDFSIFLVDIIPGQPQTVMVSSTTLLGIILSIGIVASNLISIIPYIKDIDKEPKKGSIILFAFIGIISFLTFTIVSSIQNVETKETYNYNPVTFKNYSVTTNNYKVHYIKEKNYFFKLYHNTNSLILMNMNNNEKVEWVCENLRDFIIIEDNHNYILAYIDYMNHHNYFLKYAKIKKEELSDERSFLESIDRRMNKYLLPEDLSLLSIYNREENDNYLAAYNVDYGYYILTKDNKLSYMVN